MIAAGRSETVDATLVEPLVPGDLVLVHAGVAIANLSEQSDVPRTVASLSTEPTSFLYPFIDSEERDSGALIADLAESALLKIRDSARLRATTIEQFRDELVQVAQKMAERFDRGGRLFAFGNGGSATDAEGIVELFRGTAGRGRPLPAMSLVDDRAVITALANDVGFGLVFSRQIIAHANEDDIAVGFSTSGDSANVLNVFEEARNRGMLTIGLAGYQGGAMSTSGSVDHCFVVRSDSVHRIQEAQDLVVLRLWEMLQMCLVDRTREGRTL